MTGADRDCILRYATGITLCLALAFGIGWMLSSIAPVLTAAFLGNRGPRPSLKASLSILLAIVLIFGTGLFATVYLYHYPLVFLLLFCSAIYLNFYMAASGASTFVVLLCTMAILLLPLIGGPKPWLALSVSTGFFTSALVALVCTQVAHTLFPGGTAVAATLSSDKEPQAIAASAWLSTAVVLPIAVLCLVFNLSGAVLPLIMIAMLSQKPDFSTGAAGGKALIAANLGGGLVAVIFFQLLEINPSYPFLLAGFFALALLFGRGLFSDKAIAPLYGSAFSTVLILIGSSTSSFSEGAGSEFYQRIVLIIAAVCYVVGALSVLHSFHAQERWLRVGRRIRARLTRVARLLPGS
ncbi:MAG: DUF2955 domain-containing protein [Halieaceae bacterium]